MINLILSQKRLDKSCSSWEKLVFIIYFKWKLAVQEFFSRRLRSCEATRSGQGSEKISSRFWRRSTPSTQNPRSGHSVYSVFMVGTLSLKRALPGTTSSTQVLGFRPLIRMSLFWVVNGCWCIIQRDPNNTNCQNVELSVECRVGQIFRSFHITEPVGRHI